MNRQELEHLIRAAAAITDQYEIVIVGSQSILGSMPDAPRALLMSNEADLYPLHAPSLANVIDGAIGELSPFDERFGYYAQGVSPKTAILPAGWEDRLVKVQNSNTDLKIGYCLEPHDLAASKLAAGREKDWPFVEAMLSFGLIDREILGARIIGLPLAEDHRQRLATWLLGQEQRDADAKREREKRVENLPALRSLSGAAHTFGLLAEKAISDARSGEAVDWSEVEQRTIRESIAVHGQSAASVTSALCEHSPGAVLKAARDLIAADVQRFAAEWRKGNDDATSTVRCEG